MKKKIKLTDQELDLANKLGFNFSSNEIYLTDIEIKKIREQLGCHFSELGLKDDDEPNELGLKIENLIDVFGRPLNLRRSLRRDSAAQR